MKLVKMANFIPMVSSSPPPMDDGGFGWDDDDEEFGTFTGADDSFGFQSVPDTTSNSGNLPPDNDSSSGSRLNQDTNTWHLNNDKLIENNIEDHVDNNFGTFPKELRTEETDDSVEKCDTRPTEIHIDPHPIKEYTDTSKGEKVEDKKGPLTDSGLYSADVSPVPLCVDGEEDNPVHGNSDSLEEISTSSSPISTEMTANTHEENEKEDAEYEFEIDTQRSGSSKQVQTSDEKGHESRHCSDTVVNASVSLEPLDERSGNCSPVSHDQCDKDIVISDEDTEDSLVTTNVQEMSAEDHFSAESLNFATKSTKQNEYSNEIELETDNTAKDCYDNNSSLSQNNDSNESSDQDESDLRIEKEMNNPPSTAQQALDTNVPSCVSETDIDNSNSQTDMTSDNFSKLDSASTELAAVNDYKEVIGDLSGKNDYQSHIVNDEFGDFSEAGNTSNVDCEAEITDDWGEFGNVSNIDEDSGTVPTVNGNNSEINHHKPVSDTTDVFENSHNHEGATQTSSMKINDEVENENQNHSSGPADSFDPSAIKPSGSVTSGDREEQDGTFAAFGIGEEDEFSDFKDPNDFGNFSDADEFGSFNDMNDTSKIDSGQTGFADFGEASSVTYTEQTEGAENDWASFSGTQTVEVAESPTKEEEDEWAAFSDEPVQASTLPPVSKVLPQKMSQQEKLVFAITTVFPCEEKSIAVDTPVSDLDGIVSEKAAQQGEVNVWLQIKAVHSTNAVAYQYLKSHWNDRLFTTLHVDTRNVLIGHKKAPVPIFASGLTLLEPTKGTSVTLKPDVLVDTSKIITPSVQSQEAIPPAQFDWNSSGLKNPLEADNKTLNLDFLIQDQAVKSNALESEFLGYETFEPPKKSSMQPLENILANMKSVSTVKHINQQENISQEVLKVVNSLPNLSFMKSKVLMFPLKLDQ